MFIFLGVVKVLMYVVMDILGCIILLGFLWLIVYVSKYKVKDLILIFYIGEVLK